MTDSYDGIDEEACAEIMRRHCFETKREAINFALAEVAGRRASLEEARALRGQRLGRRPR